MDFCIKCIFNLGTTARLFCSTHSTKQKRTLRWLCFEHNRSGKKCLFFFFLVLWSTCQLTSGRVVEERLFWFCCSSLSSRFLLRQCHCSIRQAGLKPMSNWTNWTRARCVRLLLAIIPSFTQPPSSSSISLPLPLSLPVFCLLSYLHPFLSFDLSQEFVSISVQLHIVGSLIKLSGFQEPPTILYTSQRLSCVFYYYIALVSPEILF